MYVCRWWRCVTRLRRRQRRRRIGRRNVLMWTSILVTVIHAALSVAISIPSLLFSPCTTFLFPLLLSRPRFTLLSPACPRSTRLNLPPYLLSTRAFLASLFSPSSRRPSLQPHVCVCVRSFRPVSLFVVQLVSPSCHVVPSTSAADRTAWREKKISCQVHVSVYWSPGARARATARAVPRRRSCLEFHSGCIPDYEKQMCANFSGTRPIFLPAFAPLWRISFSKNTCFPHWNLIRLARAPTSCSILIGATWTSGST